MAEILLSLTIIGVVAAITLPSLTGNINERTWNTQRKALYARMSQAISLMPALNGYGTLSEKVDENGAKVTDENGNNIVDKDTAAETFITAGLAKVLKINNICDNAHLGDCGIVSSFRNIANSSKIMPTTLHGLYDGFRSANWQQASYSTVNSGAAAFETQNGESVIAYYNRNCRTEYLNQDYISIYGNVSGFHQSVMCVNFIYDLNGSKGPNTVGKDIGFMTVFNSVDSVVVAPMPSQVAPTSQRYSWYDASKVCTGLNSESRLPNIDELSSMAINGILTNSEGSVSMWSSTVFSRAKAYTVSSHSNFRSSDDKDLELPIQCIRR